MSERAGIVELLGRIEKVLAEPADNLIARARHDAVRRIESALKAGGYPEKEPVQLRAVHRPPVHVPRGELRPHRRGCDRPTRNLLGDMQGSDC